MKRATGIGGIFFKTKDPKAMKAWYNRHLGVPIPNPYSGLFEWREKDNPNRVGYTVWSPFDKDTDYFGEGEQTFMINYRVENLAELLEVLKQEGIKVVKEMEEHEYGKFAWIQDPEGNRIELWEPIDEGFQKINNLEE